MAQSRVKPRKPVMGSLNSPYGETYMRDFGLYLWRALCLDTLFLAKKTMPIYTISNRGITPIKERPLSLEEEIQTLTEQNLQTIFGLDFVSSEFALHNFRIDTLAFDNENSSFVIIEYKRDRSFSVVDQGVSYLNLMVRNKADFILELNEKVSKNFKKEQVDWSQSKVIFLANSYTTYQRNAVGYGGLPIELWEVKIFDNNTVLYNQIIAPDTKESINRTSYKAVEQLAGEVKVYTLDDHLNTTSDRVKNLGN